MATLKDAKIGQTVRVKKLTGEGAVKRRIMDMGITKGVEVYIRKVAPLGDPIEITVRGYELSLRKAQFLKEDREDLCQSEHRDGNQPQNHNRDMEYHGR